MAIASGDVESHYRILVSRSYQRPQADLYAFNLTEIPIFSVPLGANETELTVDLPALLDQVYERGGYEVAINYSNSPTAPISDSDAEWLNRILKDKAIR